MQSKVRYKSVKTNDEYITIPVKINGLSLFLVDDERVSQEVYRELQSVYFGILNFEKEQCIYVRDDIALRKDSVLGHFVLSHPENFINDDTDVTYKKVVDALSVATFEDNNKMFNKILPLFKNRISGRKEELADVCDLKVLNYILENGNFEEFLNRHDGIEELPKKYVVYEDGKYFFSDLIKENSYEKVKK